MKKGIISLGEALIDFIPLDSTNTTYQKSPGGAPANVAVGVARLGAKSTFLGKVGDDVLGRFLHDTLCHYRVQTRQMRLTPDVRTGVVFVTNAEDGERSFDFYINPSADRFLKTAEILEDDFYNHRILHFGSISMIGSPAREATCYAVDLARENGMIVSYDPNLRLALWDSEEHARNTIRSMLGRIDLLKISEEELEFITGEKAIYKGFEKLAEYNIPLILITLGAEGSYVCTKQGNEHIPAMSVKAVDTTGAGDAFVSGMLYSLNEYEGDIQSLTLEEAVQMAKFAAVSGALAASTKGAMTSLPSLEEVRKYLQEAGEQYMSKDKQLRKAAYEEIAKFKTVVEQDPYRLHYHIMPPVGLLNDPNGFIHWHGKYHLFYQWMPFKTGHGAKYWGHYSSQDLVNWKHEEIALTPSEWYEKNGCYSGSAMEYEGKLYVFYTGNVKDEQGNRETYQCLAVSEGGIHFEKKGPVVKLPEGYTAHFRDPKVWSQDGRYFMVVGAQTNELKGAVALFQSENLMDWEYVGVLTGGGKGILKDFGYMFECPDLFNLDGKDILIFSPQGLQPEGMRYQNVYQAGFVIGAFDPNIGTYEHGGFDELDRGFDFYAPQTTKDSKGRRILFAWMSVPDQNEQSHPTIKHQWLHNMTVPRELKLTGDKLFQLPVKELEDLRVGEAIQHQLELKSQSYRLEGINGKSVELLVEDIVVSKGWFDITIGGAAQVVYSSEQHIFTLERQSYVNGVVEKRQCQLERLYKLCIFIDTSSIEVFINEGEEVFTSRFYPSTDNHSIQFRASEKCHFTVTKWELAKIF